MDDEFVVEHIGGYTPFEADISHLTTAGKQFKLTVAVSDVLNWDTLPPGRIEVFGNGKRKQHTSMIFNYAGLSRSTLSSVSDVFIAGVTIVTDVEGSNGILKLNVRTTRPIDNSSTS